MNSKTSKTSKTKVIIGICSVLIIALVAFSVTFKVSPVSWALWGIVNTTDEVAIEGYDPVAYHREAKAIKGDASLEYRWNNVSWYFSSAENRALFQSNPEMYVPQFGGFCATAVSTGLTIDVNPEAWHVDNNKLYLFFDTGSRDSFVEAIPNGIIVKGEGHWIY